MLSTSPHGVRRQTPELLVGCGQHFSLSRMGWNRFCGTPWTRSSSQDPGALVPLLDDPVPQTVDTVLEFFRSLDLPVDEQVIAVPKISFDRVSQRLVERRLPQIVEQLVEVPTVLTPTRIALQIAEQIVGIPVPRGRGEQRLQGFSPGQGSTMVSSAERISERTVKQIIDIPCGGLHGFSPGQGSTSVSSAERISERTVEQIVGFRGGGLQGFSPGQGSTAFSSAERLSERTAEQSVDIPGGGLHGFSSGQVSTPFSSAKRLSERTAEHIVDVPGGGLHAVQSFLPGSSSTADIPPQPVPDPWWESLTPALQAEIEEARAQVRREQRSKRTRKKKRKKKAPRSSSFSSCARARRRQRQWHVSGFSGDVSSSRCVPFGCRQAQMLGIMAGMTRRAGFSLRPLVSGSHLFAVLSGLTVDTCYVSLHRLLWVDLFVFSAMLGSTVALRDDFLELFESSAMLGSTVALGDDFVAMVVFIAMLGSTLDTCSLVRWW